MVVAGRRCNGGRRGRPGNAPLHGAPGAGQIEAVKLLLSAGAEIDARDDRGRTPLHEAARKGRVEVAEYLIGAGAQPNLTDGLGQTPLDTAQTANQWGVATLLLNYCEKTGHCGRSGFHSRFPSSAVVFELASLSSRRPHQL